MKHPPASLQEGQVRLEAVFSISAPEFHKFDRHGGGLSGQLGSKIRFPHFGEHPLAGEINNCERTVFALPMNGTGYEDTLPVAVEPFIHARMKRNAFGKRSHAAMSYVGFDACRKPSLCI